MNGNNELLMGLEAADAALDKYEKEIGFNENNNVYQILKIDYSQLNKLSPEEYAANSLLLSQFNIYLQRKINIENSRIIWLEEKIKKIITPRLNQQKAYSYEERRMLAVREDDVASRLEDCKIKTQLKISRLNYLTDKIKNFSDKMMDMAKFGRNNRI